MSTQPEQHCSFPTNPPPTWYDRWSVVLTLSDWSSNKAILELEYRYICFFVITFNPKLFQRPFGQWPCRVKFEWGSKGLECISLPRSPRGWTPRKVGAVHTPSILVVAPGSRHSRMGSGKLELFSYIWHGNLTPRSTLLIILKPLLILSYW